MSALFEHYSLKNHNTFGLEVSSRYFFKATSLDDLLHFFKTVTEPGSPFMIIGEGSNILFSGDYNGTLVQPALRGIEIVSENEQNLVVKAAAGENWDEFTSHCVEKNWSGIENLSLIPGSVGSSPVQNIGAYGLEVKDRIHEVSGFYIKTGTQKTFTNKECRFDYRNSIFKKELKNQFIITSVSFVLDKVPSYVLSYGPVEKEFRAKKIQDLKSLRQTIIDIRQSKLPDPSKIGNAGSFFKNPLIPEPDFHKLKSRFPDIPSYPAASGFIKIPAAWMIENAGWKGVREGNTGTYPTQALVIVNYGKASGEEIITFARKIMSSVYGKFGVTLEMEVNLV